jgi:diacylglycerol kinase (ATP)
LTDPAPFRDDLLWYEVGKSKKAPKRVRQAVEAGAKLILAWGGDGLVQHCLDTVAGSDVPVGIIPAGTANLLAHNLGIPENLREALHIALTGRRRSLDLGRSTASTSQSWQASASTPSWHATSTAG